MSVLYVFKESLVFDEVTACCASVTASDYHALDALVFDLGVVDGVLKFGHVYDLVVDSRLRWLGCLRILCKQFAVQILLPRFH